MRFPLIAVFLFFICLPAIRAQKSDSLKVHDSIARQQALHKKLYSVPRRATIMSAILPGLGQIYNGKGSYFKVPIIYAGLGGLGYLFYTSNKDYQFFKTNVKAAYDGDASTTYDNRYTPEQLKVEKDRFKKTRDLSAFGFVGVYVLNIIDANVFGHLKTFDVSDDLSMNVSPWQNIYVSGSGRAFLTTGISLKLNIK